MKVVVIGGGVIGYSAAHALALRGADVHIVDMRGAGHGATRASAGMLAPYIEGHDESLLQLGVASLALFDDFIAQLESDAGLSVEYRRSGTLQAAWSPEHAERLRRASAELQARGVPHLLLTGAQVLALEPGLSPGVACGLRIPAHGYVQVGNLMSALTRACERLGVTSSIGRIHAIDPSGNDLCAHTQSSSLRAQAIVLAAGCWSGQVALAASVPLAVKPVRGQSLELGLDAAHLSHVVWGDGCYLVPWQNHSIVVGATVEDVGFDESSTPDGIAMLLTQARATLPAISSATLREVRVGLRPVTADQLPLVGWSSTMPGVCLATGHYRNGILLAPLTAKLIADTLLGESEPEMRWARTIVSPTGRELQ